MPASIHPPVQLHIVLDEDSYQGGDSVAHSFDGIHAQTSTFT